MTDKTSKVIMIGLAACIVLPWLVVFLSTHDVLQEVQSFRRELRESRIEMEGEILNRTESRLFFAKEPPNIWELIDANNLKVPAGWER